MYEVLHSGFSFPANYKNLKTALLVYDKEVQWTLGAILYRTRFLPLRWDGFSLSRAPFMITLLIKPYVMLVSKSYLFKSVQCKWRRDWLILTAIFDNSTLLVWTWVESWHKHHLSAFSSRREIKAEECHWSQTYSDHVMNLCQSL